MERALGRLWIHAFGPDVRIDHTQPVPIEREHLARPNEAQSRFAQGGRRPLRERLATTLRDLVPGLGRVRVAFAAQLERDLDRARVIESVLEIDRQEAPGGEVADTQDRVGPRLSVLRCDDVVRLADPHFDAAATEAVRHGPQRDADDDEAFGGDA
jgi:hypothetical protein